jgi:hypothetical protein
VTRRIVIEDKSLKKNQPWVPVIESIDGIDFMKICKWDRKLAMFVMGVGMDLRKRSPAAGHNRSMNVQFLEQMQKLRTSTCDDVVADMYAVDDAMREGQHKTKKARKAKSSDRCIAPRYVLVECPPVARGLVQVPGRSINMLFDVKNHPVWIEANSANLDYFRQGILSSIDARELGSHCWSKLRNNANAADGEVGDSQASERAKDEAAGSEDEPDDKNDEAADKKDKKDEAAEKAISASPSSDSSSSSSSP